VAFFAVLLRTFAPAHEPKPSRARHPLALQHLDLDPAPLHQRALLEHEVAEAQPPADLEEVGADRDPVEARRRQRGASAFRSARDLIGTRWRDWTMRSAVARSRPSIAATSTSRGAVLTLTRSPRAG
jgi:hypothetical protein